VSVARFDNGSDFRSIRRTSGKADDYITVEAPGCCARECVPIGHIVIGSRGMCSPFDPCTGILTLQIAPLVVGRTDGTRDNFH